MKQMTKAGLKKQVKALLKESMARSFKRIDVLLNSGAVDLDGRDADDMGMAKVVACHILEEEAVENRPLSIENLKNLKNLRHF